MPDRDPTPGELRIMFNNIMDSLRDVKETMATKEFVNTKFDSYNDRMARVEIDLKELSRATAADRAKLEADALARQEILHVEIDTRVLQVNTRIDTLEKEQKTQQQRISQQRSGRTLAIVIVVLGSVLSLIANLIAQGLTGA